MKAIDTGLYTALNTDAGTAMGTVTGSLNNLGATAVYNTIAPQTAALPYVVFSQQSGIGEWVFDDRAWKSTLYLVKAVGQGHSAATPSALSDRFDTVLNDKPLTLTGWTCERIRREQDVKYAEVSEGVIYHHIGGLYRIDVQET
jgi:hypothetical protein